MSAHTPKNLENRCLLSFLASLMACFSYSLFRFFVPTVRKTPNYYEAAAFEALKGRVRSGDIAVGGSRRYRAFEGYLLSQPHFEQLAQKNQTRLAVTNAAEAYLETMQREITAEVAALEESIGKVEGSLCLDEKGKLYLPPLEKEIPAEVERLRPQVYTMLPQIALPDLLLELDNWTGFLRPFTHLTSGDAPVGLSVSF